MHYQRVLKYGTTELPIKTCSVDGCSHKHLANGLCSTHYQRVRMNGTLISKRPTWTRVAKPSNVRGPDHRQCDECQQIKLNSEFYQHPTRKFYDRYCSECKTKRARISHVLRKYGEDGILLQEKIDAGAACEICGKLFGNNMMSIDHDHTTGKVCGILCRNCNSAIGQLGDTEELILKALEYVRRTRP